MAIQKLNSLAQNAISICNLLEQGQADTPLADDIQQLLRDIQQPVLTLVLLGLTPNSLEQTLHWLYGDAFSGFSIDSKKWPGFVELTLSDGSFAFGLRKKQQQQFDEQQAFIQALQIEMGATQSSVANPFALTAPSSRELIGLKLLIPDSVSALLDSPSLLNAIIAQTNVTMIAAPLRYTLSREDHEAVEALTSNMQGFFPLLTVDELQEDVELPTVGWWEQHKKAAYTHAPKLITKHLPASLPELLTEASNTQRQNFIVKFHTQKLSDKLGAIFERYQQAAGILEQRKAKLQPKTKNVIVDRRDTDKIRQLLDDSMITARKEIDTQVQELSLQHSSLTRVINQTIDEINFNNLNTDQAHSIIKLSLDDHTLDNLRKTLLSEAKNAIKHYHQQAQGHVQQVFDSMNQQLQTLAMPTLPQYQFADRHELFNALDQRLEVNLNYRGEMPKRTAMNRLGESRKLIMGISMGTMILGGIAKTGWGIDLRQSIMIFAPVILVGGFFYTYIQWPKEDAERLEKEINRVHDGLKNELRRIVSEIQRFIQQQLFDALDSQKRFLQKALQDTVQQHQDTLQIQAQTEQAKQQQAQQQIDQDLRQWQSTERQLERLKGDVQSLLRSLA